MTDVVWCIPTRGITYSVSHHVGCRLVHPDTWYQLNAIRHHDGCRLVHPAKWDISSMPYAIMTDADWCIPPSGTLDNFGVPLRRMPIGASHRAIHVVYYSLHNFDGFRLGESRLYHHSLFIRLSIITFNLIFTFVLSIEGILNLHNHITYSFMNSIHVLIHS